MAIDPLAVFHEWFEEARAAGVEAPEAMTVATADADGRPSARMLLLKSAELLPQARFLAFHCFDNLGGPGPNGLYYETIDLVDADHPQTILAYAMNGQPLPVAHGAPLRLRLERQLGYKQAKYVKAIELVESFAAIRGGKGGYWEDEGYEWYGGI